RNRLADTRIIAFATHALTAGEITGLKDPALVLTPPLRPTDDDNGLLGTEDILRLRLNKDEWLILSGCNTGESGSSEGLSALVRAFFYAGAKSLLVSQWSVDDEATQRLMTSTLVSYAKHRFELHSESLREAMISLMNSGKGSQAYFAHPFAWAPFVVVGE